ncbi:MAG: nucleic acid-binding protein [Methanomicrobiales archaeon]|nr:nucleic acid-binding protein [Methanomicrobiales archaeon]
MSDNSVYRKYEREPAKRVFAAELREAFHHFREGTDEKSPTFLLLPTGERCNRVFIAGTLTEKKKSEGEAVFYQVRVVDPTGTFFVSAGSYQPEALHQISTIESPAFVVIVGKPGVFQSPDGRNLVSVRAEAITAVDKSVVDCWILDTARLTLDRIEKETDDPDHQKAAEIYQRQPDFWRSKIRDALSSIQL